MPTTGRSQKTLGPSFGIVQFRCCSMKAAYFHEIATYSNSCICCMQPVHRFPLDMPTWGLLLMGCLAPGLCSLEGLHKTWVPGPRFFSFGKPPPKMGARPQGILLEKLHQKWAKGPRASFLETNNNPKTIQKNPRKSQKVPKKKFSVRK